MSGHWNTESLSLADVDQAPEAPGIYAWYGRFSVGLPDWREDMVGGEDKGVDHFRRSLMRHSDRHRQAPLVVTAAGGQLNHFQGSLRDTTFERLSSSNAPAEEDRFNDNNLEHSISTEAQRRVMVDALARVAPLFAAPLYIGVAKALQTRLLQHRSRFYRLRRGLQNSADREAATAKLLNVTKDVFASRALAMGFSEEHLVVYFMPFDKLDGAGETSTEDLRQLAESVEYLCNRWYRPKLGRA